MEKILPCPESRCRNTGKSAGIPKEFPQNGRSYHSISMRRKQVRPTLKELVIKRIEGRETVVIALLSVFSLAIRLYLIASYPAPVFDEIYYLPGGGESLGRSVFIPDHPPLGLFLITISGKIAGACTFGWRFLPALFGSSLIPLTWLLSRRLWKNSEIALVSAFLVAFDPLLFLWSRLAMLDIFLCFFTVLSALFFSMRQRALSAFSLGLAILTKWSALPLIAAFSAFSALEFLRGRTGRKEMIRAVLMYLTVPALTYCSIFLTIFCKARPELFAAFHAEHLGSLASIPGAAYLSSPWWSWLIIPQYLPLADQQIQTGETCITVTMKALELPAFTWAAAAAFLFSAAGMSGRAFRDDDESPLLPLLAFSFLYFPWAFSGRGTYLYYLIPAIPFLSMLLAHALHRYLKDGVFFNIKLIFLITLFLSFFAIYPHLVGWTP